MYAISIEDGQWASGTTVLLPSHFASSLRELVKLISKRSTVLSISYSKKILFHIL